MKSRNSTSTVALSASILLALGRLLAEEEEE